MHEHLALTDILRGERVRLTAVHPTDITTLGGIRANVGLLRALDTVPAVPPTEAQVVAWVEHAQSATDGYLFAIRPLADDRVLGWIELDGINWQHGTTSFSIALDPAAQGHGNARDALRVMLRFCFDELNLHRVSLTVFAFNTRAIRLYESLGFTHEGTHREFFARDGRRHDMLLYGLLRREWEGRARADE